MFVTNDGFFLCPNTSPRKEEDVSKDWNCPEKKKKRKKED